MEEQQHTKTFINSDTANQYLCILQKEIIWCRLKASPNSRLVCRWKPGISLSDIIIEGLVNQIESIYKNKVLGVFLNLYKNGQDYCPYHKDRYGEDIDVYTLTLGESRTLLLKPDGTGTKAKSINLESGDLYFMSSEFQKNNKHSIPKRKNLNGIRISIVFFTKKIIE